MCSNVNGPRREPLHELALFAGVGGGLLGSRLLGWRTVCAVEKEPYRREVLLRRQRDGVLDLFPIWDCIETFDGRPWRGVVDIVTAGFPCQPFSTASRGRRVAPNLYEHIERIVAEVRPRYVLLENVLECAYPMECRPVLHSHCPSELGAPHRRRRVWLAAHADDTEQPAVAKHAEVAGVSTLGRVDWWQEGPGRVLGMDDVVAHRMERLGCIGNGQVPAVVRLAWLTLVSGGEDKYHGKE